MVNQRYVRRGLVAAAVVLLCTTGGIREPRAQNRGRVKTNALVKKDARSSGRLGQRPARTTALAAKGRTPGHHGNLKIVLRPGTHSLGLPGRKAQVEIPVGTEATMKASVSTDGKRVQAAEIHFSKPVKIKNALPLAAEARSQYKTGRRAPLLQRMAARVMNGAITIESIVITSEVRQDGSTVLRPTIKGRASRFGIPIPLPKIPDALLPTDSIGSLASTLGLSKTQLRPNLGKLSSKDAVAFLNTLMQLPTTAEASFDTELSPKLLNLPIKDKVRVRGNLSAKGTDRGTAIDNFNVEVKGGGYTGRFKISGSLEKDQ